MRRFGGEREGGGERRFRACALRKRMRRRDFCLLGGETKKRCLPKKVQLLFRVSLVVFFVPFFGTVVSCVVALFNAALVVLEGTTTREQNDDDDDDDA